MAEVNGPAEVRSAVGAALRDVPLKDMEPSLLHTAVLHEGVSLGVDVDRLAAAMDLAAYLHRDDTRSNRRDLPVDVYVTHPFRLVLRLVRYGCADTDVLCAAALHDTVEDHPAELAALLGGTAVEPPQPAGQQTALDLLGLAFGPTVAQLVSAVTNPPGASDGTVEERHRAYRAHVAEAITDPQVFLVKLADFVDNARSVRYLDDDARRARLSRKYAPLVPIFRAALASHRSVLPVGPDGLGQMDEHLTDVGLTPT